MNSTDLGILEGKELSRSGHFHIFFPCGYGIFVFVGLEF